MTQIIVRFLFLFVIVLAIEWMAYRSVQRAWSATEAWWMWRRIWWAQVILINGLFLLCGFMWPTWRVDHPKLLSLVIAFFIATIIPKLMLTVVQALEDVRWLLVYTKRQVTGSLQPVSRATFLTYIGQGAAALTFVGFLYGIFWGKYAYRVEKHRVGLRGLGEGLNGMRIVQISDAHLGSFFGTPQPVLDALTRIQELRPDVIVFTGDLVNLEASEAEPWIDAFAALSAPLGKFSIMGNHDYADYGPFTPEERLKSVEKLHLIHQQMGFRLLLNEHVKLERDGDQLVLAGVENWGVGFRKSGDLGAALKGAGEHPTVLLSHDPTHWEKEVMGGLAPVDLTLSGHTHGMQMGLEIPSLGVKFSPSKARYPRWGGMYAEGNQLLHVNRGFGVLMFQGRVGMPPEITVIDLEVSDQTKAMDWHRVKGNTVGVA